MAVDVRVVGPDSAVASNVTGGALSWSPPVRHGRRWASLALGLVASVAVLGACGGPGSAGAPRGAPSSGSPAMSQPAAPNPNAPEVNAAGDIPDQQVYVGYTPPDGLFMVSVPQGWARTVTGTATVYTDKFNSVRIETIPRPQAPTVTSAQTQEVGQLRGASPGFQLGQVQMVQRSAGPAVLITYQASSAPNPVTGKTVTESVERYEFWRQGQEVALTLSGPKGADNVDPWRMITDSFRWQR